MVFTIVSAAQEKLNEFMNKLKNNKEDEKLRKEREAEEAERTKFTGTPVTLETFVAWRKAFEQEMMKTKVNKEETFKGKLTGREPLKKSMQIIHCTYIDYTRFKIKSFESFQPEFAGLFCQGLRGSQQFCFILM